MGSRGQVGVEFFLVAAFMLALAAVMLTVAEGQLGGVESLDKAALSKSAVDSTAAMVDYVYLSGNYSQLRGEVFVPQGSLCFILNSSRETIQCDSDPSIPNRVESRPMRTAAVSFNDSCPPTSSARGWFGLTVTNVNNSVTVNCTSLG